MKPSPRTLLWLSFLLVGLAALFLSFRNIYGEDIGFHLQAGRWMLQHFSLPPESLFTYTAKDVQYIDLNWLYQVLMYGIYSFGGSAGLIVINSLLVLGTIFILMKRVDGGQMTDAGRSAPWVILLSIIAASALFEIRPHSISWLLLCLTSFILQKHYDGNTKIIRWLPAILLLWVNLHSLFILGLVVFGCYAISLYLRDKKLSKEFLLISALTVLACFINPYGWKGVAFPFEQFAALRSGNVFKENIRELQSPFHSSLYKEGVLHALFHEWVFFDLFTAAAFLLLILGYRQRKIHEWLLFFIFFYFAWSAGKNIGYFIFAVTPFLVSGLSPEKKAAPKKDSRPVLRKRLALFPAIALPAICLLLILAIRSNAFYIHYRMSYRFGLDWSNSNLPVKAVEFINKNDLHGKLLNQLDFGGYLEFFLDQKVSIDGRLDFIGEKEFDEQVNAITDQAKQRLLDKYTPDIIIFSYFVVPDWIVFLQKQPGWRLGYLDGNAAVYLKNGYKDSVAAFTEQSLMSSYPHFSDQEIDALVKGKSRSGILSSLLKIQYFPESEHNLTAFCFYYGWGQAAKQVMANAFSKASSDYPEMYLNMGSVYFQFKDRDRSLYCYQRYLKDRKNEQVEKRVAFLRGI